MKTARHAPNQLQKLVTLVCCLILASHACAAQKVEFWTLSMKPKFTPYFQGVVQKFHALHPDIEVEWVDFPWDILQLKLITAIAAGTPPG